MCQHSVQDVMMDTHKLIALYLVAFFLPWIATALPFRVRALFFVFWPRTGSLCTTQEPFSSLTDRIAGTGPQLLTKGL